MNQGELEEIKAAYFNPDCIREAPRRLYRSMIGGQRYYHGEPGPVAADGKARVRLFPSVTTVIAATTPMAPYLLDWISQHGKRRAEYLRDSRAAYGTTLHILLADLVIAGTCDLDALPEVVEMRRQTEGFDFETSYWAAELAQDIVGFVSAWQKLRAKALAIEVPLASDRLGYAGTVDLVIEADIERGVGAGRPKVVSREICLFDWKSSRTAFYDSGAIQVNAYKRLWEEAFPELPIVSTWQYGCSDWDDTSRQRYRLREETDHQLAGLFPSLLDQWKIRQSKTRASLSLKGKVSLTSSVEASIVSEPVEVALANRLAERAAKRGV